MSKHTPGKWEIEPLEVFGRGDREGTADIVVHDEDGEGSAVIAKGIGYEDKEERANALLMASAPDLLEALEALVADAPANGLLSVANARHAIDRARGLSQ